MHLIKTTSTALLTTVVFLATPNPVESHIGDVSESQSHSSAAARVCVTSPWGYSAWYNVCPGWNTLICVGTGCRFRYCH